MDELPSSSIWAPVGDKGPDGNPGPPGPMGPMGGSIPVVETIALLRAFDSSTTSISTVFVLGYYSNSDGGGGVYHRSTGVDNGGTIIAATDGTIWELSFTNYLDIKNFGAVRDQNISSILNIAGSELFRKSGGTLYVNGSYNIGSKVRLYPLVHVKGAGSGYNTRLTCSYIGECFETYRPAGYIPLCTNAQLTDMSLIGRGIYSSVNCLGIRNAMQCNFQGLEIALFGKGVVWNSGHTPDVFVQAFFNTFSQNIIKPCGIAHYFGGATNRNTFSTNSYSDCDVAYDFTAANNWSETNTFMTENVEGCKSWAEWNNDVYSQTWINLCVENPTTNGYICLIKDPGRQVFVNLSIIPLGNPAAIIMYALHEGQRSSVFGSAASSGTNRLGTILEETLVPQKTISWGGDFKGAYIIDQTIPANSTFRTTVQVAGASINRIARAACLRDLHGCSLECFCEEGQVVLTVSNPTLFPVTITPSEISIIIEIGL